MLCERCGSIDVARSRSSRFDKLVRLFTGRKRFSCKRCGWTARRAWEELSRPEWTKAKLVPPPQGKAVEEFDFDQFD